MPMRRIVLACAAAVSAAAVATAEGEEAPAPEDTDALVARGERALPGLRLDLVPVKERYEQGEPVKVTMRYTYDGDRRLNVTVVKSDRSGRIADLFFSARDEAGEAVLDPVTPYGFGGGPRGSRRLARGWPYEQTVAANEWLCLDRPGRYRVRLRTWIVSFEYNGTRWSGPAIPLESGEVEIEVVPFDERRRLEQIAALEAELKDGDLETRVRAMRELRFMVDARAVPLLVRGLEDPHSGVSIQAEFGLMSFRDSAPVEAEIMRIVAGEGLAEADRITRYSRVLAAFDARAPAGERPGQRAYGRARAYKRAFERWRELLARGIEGRIDDLPPVRAAEATVDAVHRGLVPRDDASNWRRIFDNVSAISAEHQRRASYLIELHLRDEVFPPGRGVAPDLARVAGDARLLPGLRSAAAIALARTGDVSARDAVFADLLAERPVLSAAAHATLGAYRAREAAERFVELVDSRGTGVRESAARRIRDFGTALTADELRRLLERKSGDDERVRRPLLEALAIASPGEALPFVRGALRDPEGGRHGLRGTAIRILARIDPPGARELIRETLASDDAERRQDMVTALGGSCWKARWAKQAAPGPAGERFVRRVVPPSDEVAPGFVPELVRLYTSDPSGAVREAAKNALPRITGIPDDGLSGATKARTDACVPLWEEWARGRRPRPER